MRKLYALAIFLFLSGSILAQDITVTGKITDGDDGTELPGVSILIKDSDKGTITDFEGNFSLDVPSDAILIVQYLGYVAQEISVDNRTTIDIPMSADVEVLEEVVVIGYGVVEKGDVTGVVKKVDEKDFNRGVISSPDQLLSGKVAGVVVTNNSGEPGGQSTVRIRGGTSITAGNEPLYVIDGVPIDNTTFSPGGMAAGRNPLNFLNPSEIENITVLKDASAAAIYGSRGANGVIIITTKGGGTRAGKASDKPTITYDGNVALSTFNQATPILSPDEFRVAINTFDPDRAGNPAILGTANTDWVSEITQSATSQNHNIAIGSNIQDGSYRFNAGYQQIDGVIRGSRSERFNVNYNMSKGLLNNDLTLRFSTKNAVTNDKFASNQIGGALAFNPTQPIYLNDDIGLANGDFGGFFEYDDPLATRNPVAENSSQKQEGDGFRNISNFELTYKLPFIEGLTAKSNFSLDNREDQRVSFSPSFLKSQEGTQGFYRTESMKRQSYLFEGYLDYTREVEAVEGKFSVVGGYSYQTFSNRNTLFSHDQLFTDAFGLDAPSVQDSSNIVIDRIQFENRLISFWGRVNFDMKDRYLITATLRRDGSTRFGPENQWGLFPSLALGWRISSEDFFQGAKKYVNYLKLRFGYGVSGNQDGIRDYAYLSQYGYSRPTAAYQFGNSFIPTLRPVGVDPNLKWEETNSLNLGLDFEVFKGRLAGNIEFYQKNTSDLLFTVAFPAGINVQDRILTNIGEIQNQGIELELSSPIVNTKTYSSSVSFNAAYNQNEIKNLDNSVTNSSEQTYDWGGISGDVGQFIQVLQVGQPFESFRVYEHLYDDAGNPIFDPNNPTNMYKDQNGDGRINEDDLRVFNRAAPDWVLGLTSNSNYKDFDLSFTFRANIGNYVYNNFSSNYGELQRLEANIPQNIHTSAFETGFQRKQLKSDYYIENASFLRLDNVTLGYTMNKLEWLRMRVYVTAQNLFVVTGYSGFDPEIPNGIDNNLYPRARTILGGLTLTF